MVQLMPLPPHHLFLIKIQNGLTFLGRPYPACPGKEAVRQVFVFAYYYHVKQHKQRTDKGS